MFSLTILTNSLRLAGCPVTIYLGKRAKRFVRNFVSLSVNIPFMFCALCVKSGIWNLILPVPGHCFHFTWQRDPMVQIRILVSTI